MEKKTMQKKTMDKKADDEIVKFNVKSVAEEAYEEFRKHYLLKKREYEVRP